MTLPEPDADPRDAELEEERQGGDAPSDPGGDSDPGANEPPPDPADDPKIVS